MQLQPLCGSGRPRWTWQAHACQWTSLPALSQEQQTPLLPCWQLLRGNRIVRSSAAPSPRRTTSNKFNIHNVYLCAPCLKCPHYSCRRRTTHSCSWGSRLWSSIIWQCAGSALPVIHVGVFCVAGTNPVRIIWRLLTNLPRVAEARRWTACGHICSTCCRKCCCSDGSEIRALSEEEIMCM